MKKRKLLVAMLTVTLSVASLFTACGSSSDESTETTTNSETKTTTNAETKTTITEDEAIELVKKKFEEEYSYIPADNLEEKDGSKYYVIYVKRMVEGGSLTTIARYWVKEDGSDIFEYIPE